MTEGGVPDEFMEEFEIRRSEMIEKIAEQDDNLLEKFLLEEDISDEELKAAIRNVTISNKVVPVLCKPTTTNNFISFLSKNIKISFYNLCSNKCSDKI